MTWSGRAIEEGLEQTWVDAAYEPVAVAWFAEVRRARVDAEGNVIGFAIFNFLKRDRKTVEITLEPAQVAAAR